MKLKILSIALLALTSCQTTKLPGPLGDNPPPVASPIQPILDAAAKSDCGKFYFESQGYPKEAYLRGIAATYAKALCEPQGLVSKVGGQPIGDANIDALAHYSSKLKALGLPVSTSQERLRQVFSLTVGSTARESSWRWWLGADASVPVDQQDASTTEGGYNQTSYNCRYNRDGKTINPSRDALYKSAKAGGVACFSELYKKGTESKASLIKNLGTGEGVTFQNTLKVCPGFSTEYHILALRERRTHYGPINLQNAQVTKQCSSMFQKIEEAIAVDPNICLNFK